MATKRIKAVCPHCKKPFETPATNGGKLGRCPSCRKEVRIPFAGPDECIEPAEPVSAPKAERQGVAPLAGEQADGKKPIERSPWYVRVVCVVLVCGLTLGMTMVVVAFTFFGIGSIEELGKASGKTLGGILVGFALGPVLLFVAVRTFQSVGCDRYAILAIFTIFLLVAALAGLAMGTAGLESQRAIDRVMEGYGFGR